MGICLTSRKSSYSFEMGYGGFNNLRTIFAKYLTKNLEKCMQILCLR